MRLVRASIIFALGVLMGLGMAVVGYRLRRRGDVVAKAQHLRERTLFVVDRVFNAKVRNARLKQAVAPLPYFPPGSAWTQDVSHAPLDPESSSMITWLANAGGWGRG